MQEYIYMRFLLVNGKMLECKDFVFSEELIDAQNIINTKVWFGYGGIPLFDVNVGLIIKQCDQLSVSLPDELNDLRELTRITKRMLNKNKFYRSGHITIKIIHSSSAINSIITATPFKEFVFPFSEAGLLVQWSGIKKYTGNKINRLPFFNERLWQAALAEVSDRPVQQVVILNEQGFVSECAFGNIYMIAGNELITPSFQAGCHENTLRPLVLQAAGNAGLQIYERNFISKEMLLNADEVFIASEAIGLNWIMGIDSIRYIHYYSKVINEELNRILKNMAVAMHSVI